MERTGPMCNQRMACCGRAAAGANRAPLSMQRAFGTKQTLQALIWPTKLTWQEEARAGSLGGLHDGHLRLNGHQADRGDDDMHTSKHWV